MDYLMKKEDSLQSRVSELDIRSLGGRGAGIQIIDYRPEHQPYFEAFNRSWIEKYFWLEEIDKYVLQHPEEAIIKKGGAVLMATCNGEVAGAVALKKVNDDVYEFTKMAVHEAHRRKGIAEAITYAAFNKAKALGAKKVILYSNRILTPAIAMYHKLGFVEVPLEKGIYQRSDIKMEVALDLQEQRGTEK
jgi:ribosomal protein S18 acetylase RimI-like enzyme